MNIGFDTAEKEPLKVRLDFQATRPDFHRPEALAEARVTSEEGQPITVDPDPWLHGFWGDASRGAAHAPGVATLSHQSVLLGSPAVQMELPPRLRVRL